MPSIRLLASVLVGLSLMMGLASCNSGPVYGDVKGRVTFKGQPVTEGNISFFSAEIGSGGDAKLGEDGAYVIKTKNGGLVVGDYIVFITPELYLDKSDPTTPPALIEKKAPNIPLKYRRDGSTPLKATVAPGKNEINFDMLP